MENRVCVQEERFLSERYNWLLGGRRLVSRYVCGTLCIDGFWMQVAAEALLRSFRASALRALGLFLSLGVELGSVGA